MKLNLSEYRKGLVVIGGVAANLVATGALHGTAESWAIAVVSVLTAAGVITVRNGPKPV